MPKFDLCNWDYINEPFDNLNDWTDSSGGTTTVEISPAGQLRLYVDGSGNNAAVEQDPGSIQGAWTCEIKFQRNTAVFDLRVQTHGDINATYIRFADDGIHVYDGTQYNLVHSIDWEQDAWYTVTWNIHNSESDMDVWLDGVKVATDADCGFAGGTIGYVEIFNMGRDAGEQENHVDYLKVDFSTCETYNMTTTSSTSTSTSSTSTSTTTTTMVPSSVIVSGRSWYKRMRVK